MALDDFLEELQCNEPATGPGGDGFYSPAVVIIKSLRTMTPPRAQEYTRFTSLIRKSDGEMTRKLSVTESQNLFQFQGTFCRRKPSLASPSVSVLAPWRRAGTLLA